MNLRILVAASMLTAFVAPAFAADSYYVVQDVKTKKCTITESKPTTSEMTVVSGDTVYKTKSEAESGMKTTKVCETH
jgi:LysM repeat protein